MPSTTPPPLKPGEVVGSYQIEAALGSGPTGASYTAKATGGPAAGKKVVVKLLHGPAADAATRDALVERLKAIESEGLIKTLDAGEHAGRTYVVTEHFEGDSLRKLMDEYISQKKTFNVQEACQIVARTLEAAQAAHEAGLVHRHIKPSNILVQSKLVGPGKTVRTIKLAGLGTSELVHSGVLAEQILDRPDNRYLSPELSSLGSGGTPQADVYSAGTVFYEILTGQTPMGTYLSPSQIRDDLPKHVDDIVDISLAANAEDRYPTARDMVADIQRVFSEDTPTQTAMSARTLIAVLGAVVVLVVIAGIAVQVTNPAAAARRKDEALRAEVVKENPVPDEATMRAKLADHPEMAYVPAGTYIAGRMNAESGRSAGATEPIAQKQKSGGYLIDRFEGGVFENENAVVNVTYAEAEAACAEKGKRLCTADEWERACKGPEFFVYGYGDTFDPSKCGPDVGKDADRDGRLDTKAGANPGCTNKFRVVDMAGGAREWTSTPDGQNTEFRLVKGGKPGSPERGSRCAYTDPKRMNLTDRSQSYRCCLGDGEVIEKPAPPPPPEVPVEGATPG